MPLRHNGRQSVIIALPWSGKLKLNDSNKEQIRGRFLRAPLPKKEKNLTAHPRRGWIVADGLDSTSEYSG